MRAVRRGNSRQATAVALEHFHIATLLPIGVFGDKAASREDLVKEALDLDDEVLLVGDTPADVRAGHVHACRVAGVATGLYDAASLAHAGADLILTSLVGVAPSIAALAESARRTTELPDPESGAGTGRVRANQDWAREP